MQLKEYLIKKLSLKLKVSEKTIDAVISHQFQTAFQATSHHNTIELSGFGKFVFNEAKATKKMKKYEALKATYASIISDPNSSAEMVRKTHLRLATVIKNIDHLKPKLNKNESKSDI